MSSLYPVALATPLPPARPAEAPPPAHRPAPTAALTAQAVAPVPGADRASPAGPRPAHPEITPAFRFVPSREGAPDLGPLARREGYGAYGRRA